MTATSAAPHLRGDQLYDVTATAWDSRNLRPLAHRGDCFFAPWPALVAYCACTKGQQYPRRRVAWEVA